MMTVKLTINPSNKKHMEMLNQLVASGIKVEFVAVDDTEKKADPKPTATVVKADAKVSEPVVSEPTPAPAKEFLTIGFLQFDRQFAQFVPGKYVPKAAFYAVTKALKEAGATYDKQTKVWVFADESKCKAFAKAQADRQTEKQ